MKNISLHNEQRHSLYLSPKIVKLERVLKDEVGGTYATHEGSKKYM